ncbi:serine/threonine protein kinase [Tubulinosema ratisbonensis]|uniref:Serine/threonine protein kinase n=1 Tax=Tubulinosema ratisbonensis TaxID=291195 RepID=A0A437AH95_9MICR|nr:serine/threonine protein kinase [Tubulinosema ratisbonensis]
MENYEKLFSAFEFVGFINKEAMSNVYKLQHKKSRRYYVLKEVFLEFKEDILSIISERSLGSMDLQHPNLMGYMSIVVSTKIEEVKKFRLKESKSNVNKEILKNYGINAKYWNRPNSTLTNDSVDKQIQFCAKFNESIYDPNEEISIQIDEENENNVRLQKKKRKPSFKIAKTCENYILRHDLGTKFYHYLITRWCNFTLNDFICARNEYLFNNHEIKDELLNEMVKESLIGKEVNSNFIKEIMYGIFHGVAALHSCKIIHGDVVSKNIFFIENFVPKLGDYSDSFFGDFPCERKDIKMLGELYLEMLVPFLTVNEKFHFFEDVLKNKFPSFFDEKFPKEKKIIQECFLANKRIHDILLLFNN